MAVSFGLSAGEYTAILLALDGSEPVLEEGLAQTLEDAVELNPAGAMDRLEPDYVVADLTRAQAEAIRAWCIARRDLLPNAHRVDRTLWYRIVRAVEDGLRLTTQ